ncbi:MAG: diacylglycerol kinase family protein [Pyrinomonadaceae bacterium]
MPLPLVIVNPASAGGATGDAWPGIASELRRHFGPFSCAFTKGSRDAVEIARREAVAGRTLIIACGGDGTISEVANGILQSGADAELGILPSGTGGDFRRTLKLPARTADAALALRQGRARRMDVGRVSFVNGEGAGESRYFLNVASFGMGGAVIERVKENSSLPGRSARLLGGKLSFAAAAFQTAITFTKPSVRVQLDGGLESRLVVANFCVANAQYFGGGMRVAPEAKINDGLFDVVAIGDLSPLSILTNSYRVYLGTHLGMSEVRHTRARKVSAKAAGTDGVKLEVDGELVGTLPADFEIIPGALRVRCPS